MPQREVTALSPQEEQQFLRWIQANHITDLNEPDSRYDYRGYWKDIASRGQTETQINAADHQLHYPDTYKQHGHPTFSVESKYSAGPNDGGRWNGETYVPQPPQGEVIIVADDGTEHVFPAGFDPKKAAGIVRGGASPKKATPPPASATIGMIAPSTGTGEAPNDPARVFGRYADVPSDVSAMSVYNGPVMATPGAAISAVKSIPGIIAKRSAEREMAAIMSGKTGTAAKVATAAKPVLSGALKRLLQGAGLGLAGKAVGDFFDQ